MGMYNRVQMCKPKKMWVKLKVAEEKTVIVGVYGPGMERSGNERDAFWECFKECIIVSVRMREL